MIVLLSASNRNATITAPMPVKHSFIDRSRIGEEVTDAKPRRKQNGICVVVFGWHGIRPPYPSRAVVQLGVGSDFLGAQHRQWSWEFVSDRISKHWCRG